jgi:hypothetical protein
MGYFTKPPCYNDGKDCSNRHVGCREKCDTWQEWMVIHAREKEKQYAIYRKERDADTFTAEQGDRIRKLNQLRNEQDKRRTHD